MTLESRIVADVTDLLALRFECQQCHGVISWPLKSERKRALPKRCPSCDEWILLESSPVRAGLTQVLEGMDLLLDSLSDEGCPVAIRLELPHPAP